MSFKFFDGAGNFENRPLGAQLREANPVIKTDAHGVPAIDGRDHVRTNDAGRLELLELMDGKAAGSLMLNTIITRDRALTVVRAVDGVTRHVDPGDGFAAGRKGPVDCLDLL